MKQNQVVLLVGSAFIIVLAWIIFNIFHSANTSTIPDAVTIQVAPINPNFDINTIQELKKRTKIDPALSFEKVAVESLTISPTPIPSETSSESAQLNTFQ